MNYRLSRFVENEVSYTMPTVPGSSKDDFVAARLGKFSASFENLLYMYYTFAMGRIIFYIQTHF